MSKTLANVIASLFWSSVIIFGMHLFGAPPWAMYGIGTLAYFVLVGSGAK